MTSKKRTGPWIRIAAGSMGRKEGAVHKGPPQHLRSSPKAAATTPQGGCGAGWNQGFPEKANCLFHPSDISSPHGLQSGGGRREKRKGPSCPVPTAQENSTPLGGDCTGKGKKCFLPAHPFKRDQGRPHATPGGYMVALAPLLHLVGIRMAGAGPEVLPCPFSPQREDLPRPPERRLRERLRPRTRLRSSPSSSSSAS